MLVGISVELEKESSIVRIYIIQLRDSCDDNFCFSLYHDCLLLCNVLMKILEGREIGWDVIGILLLALQEEEKEY